MYQTMMACRILIRASSGSDTGMKAKNKLYGSGKNRLNYSYVVYLHMATTNGRFCGAKRPECEADRPQAVAFIE